MSIHYYLTLFPMEAMVASQLDPQSFGAYMAVGSRKGSSERLIFIEVDGSKLKGHFDIDYAERRCVSHSDGRLKNSVYLSVYRALEIVPQEALGLLWLVTRDGRSLPLEISMYSDPEPWSGVALYQELCPARPLVVSALNPKHYAEFIVEETSKVTMPKIIFADLNIPELEGEKFTGNVGGFFDKILEHLKACIVDLKAGKGKLNKIVDRSASAYFNYQVIGRGLYVGSSDGKITFYAMPTREVLKKDYYDWGKSSLIF